MRISTKFALLFIGALFGVGALGFLFFTPQAQAAECPTNTVPATEADLPAMKIAGIKDPVVGMCWRKIDPFSGENVAQAKQQLNQMWCGGKANRCGPYVSSVEDLDPNFAVCAAKFIAAVRQRDPTVCIASAYRSTDHQRALCSGRVCGKVPGPCAPAGGSKHQSGRAIDIAKPGIKIVPSWIHEMARQGGNVSFPVNNDSGHMEPANKSDSTCATPGYIAPGNGGSVVPSSGFTQAIRQWLTPQAAQPATSAQPAVPSQPVSSSPLQSFQDQTNNVNESAPTGVSSQIDGTTGDTTHATSAADRLEELAFGTSPQTTQTGTSVPLIVSGSDAVALSGTQQQTTSAQPSPSQGAISPSETTFISGDLSWQNDNTATGPVSGFDAILITIRSTLNRILQYLTPFGARDAIVVDENGIVYVTE